MLNEFDKTYFKIVNESAGQIGVIKIDLNRFPDERFFAAYDRLYRVNAERLQDLRKRSDDLNRQMDEMDVDDDSDEASSKMDKYNDQLMRFDNMICDLMNLTEIKGSVTFADGSNFALRFDGSANVVPSQAAEIFKREAEKEAERRGTTIVGRIELKWKYANGGGF